MKRFQTLLLAAAVAAQDIRTATHGIPFDEPLSDRSSVQQKKVDPPSAPEVQIQFNMPPLNLTALGHHAGEAAVGASVGAVAAWLVHRIQSTIVLIGVLGSVSTAAAVHVHWVSLEQVHAWLVAALHFTKARLSLLMRRADMDEDGELTLNDGEVAYQRLAPVVRRHAALTGGLVGGFVSAYSALR